jgi:signal transduction histidine kinase
MRERAEQLGGRLEIASTNFGTTLSVTLPLAESNEKDAHTGSG